MNASVSKLKRLQEKSIQLNHKIMKSIDKVDILPIEGSSRVSIEISTLENFALQASEISQIEKEKLLLISNLFSELRNSTKGISQIKLSLKVIKNKFKQDLENFKTEVKRISTILKEYKERCSSTFLFFLKNLDHDLRKILIPIVPSKILKEQVNFPLINKNPSLESSNHSLNPPSPTSKQPNKPNQLELLVSTLEKVAKSLLNVLLEVNTQYYDFTKKSINPPLTPLAAPLPEYFIYETEEADLPSNTTIKEDIKTWMQRFTELFSKKIIDEFTFNTLVSKVRPLGIKGLKIDLQDIFKATNLAEELKENITFALVDKSGIQAKDVSISELMEEDKKARPDSLKEKTRPIIEKKSLDYKNVYSSIDYRDKIEALRQSPVPRIKIHSGREKHIIKKSQQSEKRNIRARSITPVLVGNEKSFIARKKLVRKL